MKAAVVRAFGAPLVIEERPDPEPGVGQVEAVGEGVTHLTVGRRVAVPWPVKACGRCEHCLSGWDIGGLGHLALQCAAIAGSTVAAIGVTDDKLVLARELGADLVIDARKQDAGQVLKQHGGAHAAIALAVNDAAFEAVDSAEVFQLHAAGRTRVVHDLGMEG
ncbi:zinc-binding dehydrogenase [Streptomyces sp. NPDC001093]|uniref:zinc-binding dehydrogenase n=1 Tax=Streptomyces sp. NPDC001093 TaxID=3154376 RepID=UPI0033348667